MTVYTEGHNIGCFCGDCVFSRDAAIADLRAKLADLEGIDKACDAANEHVRLLQADVDRLTTQLAPSPCGVEGHRGVDWVDATRLTQVVDPEGFVERKHCLACQRENEIRIEAQGKEQDFQVKMHQECHIEQAKRENKLRDLLRRALSMGIPDNTGLRAEIREAIK